MTRPRPGSLASRLGPEEAIVLVVEDEPDIASFLSAFFRASGTEVVHLDPASADEVVERAAALHVACALVDLNLSGLSGFDVLEAFAADERVADLPVIIVTADARPATQERAAALGAVGFVPKP
ncbi:MAG TPA: response regulator, partial [Acidimicrobiales bacterium]|nr:response regulator [Acidimicrobiales bacterium]